MGSRRTTADRFKGGPCHMCGGTMWDRWAARAKCARCGAIVWAKEVQPEPTREQRAETYVRRHRRKDSDRSEREHARRLGGRVQRGSGAGTFDKSDTLFQDELHELKETEAASFRLTLDDWHTVSTHAVAKGLRPAMAITFKKPGNRSVTLVLMDIHDYEQLKEAARETDHD